MTDGLLSDSALDTVIRLWKLARLGKDVAALMYPTRNILHPEWGVGEQNCILAQAVEDAERVQAIVNDMDYEMRSAFEAYHLGIVRGDQCRNYPHHARALILAISKRTYFRRVELAREFVRRQLTFGTNGCNFGHAAIAT